LQTLCRSSEKIGLRNEYLGIEMKRPKSFFLIDLFKFPSAFKLLLNCHHQKANYSSSKLFHII